MAMKKGQHIFGTVKVGEKGQIVIPKEARQIFDIKAGDTLLVLGDEDQGIAIVKAYCNAFLILECLLLTVAALTGLYSLLPILYPSKHFE